jgi:hypothetical protein
MKISRFLETLDSKIIFRRALANPQAVYNEYTALIKTHSSRGTCV